MDTMLAGAARLFSRTAGFRPEKSAGEDAYYAGHAPRPVPRLPVISAVAMIALAAMAALGGPLPL
jgi:hypothetical protein